MALFSETDEKAWKDRYDAFKGRGKRKFVYYIYLHFSQVVIISLLSPYPSQSYFESMSC